MSVTTILDWTQTVPASVQFGAGGGFVLLADWSVWRGGSVDGETGGGVFTGAAGASPSAPVRGVAISGSPPSFEAFNSPPPFDDATPGLFYRFTWSPSNTSWIVTSFSTLNDALGVIPCFTEKFLTNYAIPTGVFILKAPRNNKRILKYGDLELTDDHAVVYNNKPISWEEYLVESNKQYEELPLDEPKYIYNFIGHPDQFHETNKIKIDKNLSVAGGWSTPDLWLERIQKVKIMTNLLENNILPKEHIISNLSEIINKETNDSIYALYIPK